MKPRISAATAISPLALDAHGKQPLLEQIADYYRKQILEGNLSAGSRLPTCLELGRSLGLAPQTINRAFDLLAREGLVHRRRSLGTIVGRPSFEKKTSDQPQSVRRRHAAPPVCLVMRKPNAASEEADLASDYLQGLMEGFDAWKCRFEIAHLRPDQPDLDLVRTLVETGQTRGLINLLLNDEATEYLIAKRFPMVAVNMDLSGRGVTSVVADHVRGYSEAWKHVSEAGHRQAMFFGFDDHNYAVRLRECTAGRELVQAACQLRESVQAPDGAGANEVWQTLARQLGPWKQGGGWPTVIFAQTDLIATRLIRVLHENGLHVPRDVSVVGFNDAQIARHFHPTLTTLAKPRFKMALAASQLLLDILSRRPGSSDRLQVFPVTLVQRESFMPFTK